VSSSGGDPDPVEGGKGVKMKWGREEKEEDRNKEKE